MLYILYIYQFFSLVEHHMMNNYDNDSDNDNSRQCPHCIHAQWITPYEWYSNQSSDITVYLLYHDKIALWVIMGRLDEILNKGNFFHFPRTKTVFKDHKT